MLEVCCFSQVEGLKNVNVSYFQQDGAPAQYKGYVRDASNNKFQQRRIGRDCPKDDLLEAQTLLHAISFVGDINNVKNIILSQKISNVAQVKEKDL